MYVNDVSKARFCGMLPDNEFSNRDKYLRKVTRPKMMYCQCVGHYRPPIRNSRYTYRSAVSFKLPNVDGMLPDSPSSTQTYARAVRFPMLSGRAPRILRQHAPKFVL
jgi:hypothetical protein